jgi:lysophospholipase L1-like esterase
MLSHSIRVACVGASGTFGFGLPNRREQAYPAVLGRLLGAGYMVRNFGYSGATAGQATNEPYWETPSFLGATRFEPDVVVVALGANDAQQVNLANLPNFRDDYIALMEYFRLLPSKPEVVVVTPCPLFEPKPGFDFQALNEVIRPEIEAIADELGLRWVDAYTPLRDRPDLFPDNLHTDSRGAELLAEEVFKVVGQRA